MVFVNEFSVRVHSPRFVAVGSCGAFTGSHIGFVAENATKLTVGFGSASLPLANF